MPRSPFTWEEAGIEHWTGRDLMETLQLLGDQDEADSFLTAYAAVCDDDDHARHNIRCLAQLIAGFPGDDEEDEIKQAEKDALRICEYFDLELPKQSEALEPRHWFSNSDLGVKVEREKAVA